jgi:hypothetical protein
MMRRMARSGFEPPKSVQIALDRGPLFNWKRGDHAGKPWIAPRLLRDPRRLFKLLTLVDIDFHEHELIDMDWRRRLRQMLGQHDPFQLGRVVHPGIAEARRIAEMHMTIDDREIHQSDPSRH